MFGKKRQQARANLPAEPVEEPYGRYYLQSIDTKFISGGPNAFRVFRPLSSELACAQNRLA
jgi:hypothetical protein